MAMNEHEKKGGRVGAKWEKMFSAFFHSHNAMIIIIIIAENNNGKA
jgi:hypothetical protein